MTNALLKYAGIALASAAIGYGMTKATEPTVSFTAEKTDLSGDFLDDVIIRDSNQRPIWVLVGQNDGSFTPTTLTFSDGYPFLVTLPFVEESGYFEPWEGKFVHTEEPMRGTDDIYRWEGRDWNLNQN